MRQQRKLFEYGIASGVKVPADFPQLISTYDFHALYRRPSFSVTGERLRDADGNPLWDTTTPPVSAHFREVLKGFEFVGLADDAPAEVRAAFEAVQDA